MGLARRRRGPRDTSAFGGAASPAPDYVQPVLAWRLWHAIELDGGVALRSLFYPTVWPRREILVACCGRRSPIQALLRRAGVSGAHDAPFERCECGIYAATLRPVLDYLREPPTLGVNVLQRVVGLVSLWGNVVECENGWRASHAYPSALFVPSQLLGNDARLSPSQVASSLEGYGVAVEVVAIDGRDELAEALELSPLASAAAPSPAERR
jgi:hypothetical protein